MANKYDATTAYQKAMDTGTGSPVVGANIVRSLGDQPAVPDDSTLDTPEQAPAAEQNAQQSAANLKAVNHAISPGTAKAPQVPTEQQNVNAALEPDQKAFDALPNEYKSVLGQLAPYINSGTTPGAQGVAAETNATEAPIEKALAGLGKANKEFAKTIPNSGIVQALLGQSKYQIEYNNAQPGNESDWDSSMKDIYAYLSGTNASSDGLPTPQSASKSYQGTPMTGSSDPTNPNG